MDGARRNQTVLSRPRQLGFLPRERNLNMLQRVTLNVIQVFQRIFDAINPCIIIYEYINMFSYLFSFNPFIFIVV